MSYATPSTSARRRWIIRAAGSVFLLAVLFWLLPVDDVVAALKSIPPAVFMLVLALFLTAHIAAALKWWMLLDRAFHPMLAIRAHYAGLAANLCLPGAIGGDAVRAGLAQTAMKDGARVVAVAAADRLIDMVALLTVSGLGLALSWSDGSDGWMIVRAGLILTAMLAGMIVLPRLLPIPWRIVPNLPGRGFAERLASAFTALGRRPMTLAIAFLASTMIQLLLVLLAWWLAVAAGAEVTIGHWMFAWPLAKIIAVLPVSLNGLGLREATLAAFLTPFGADPAVIVAAGLMWQAVLFVAGGIGALVLTVSGVNTKNPATAGKESRK